MPKRKSATIPKFGSVDELVQFFDTHDMSRYWKQTPEVKFEPSAVKVKKHFVAIDQQFAAELDRIAKKENLLNNAASRCDELWIGEPFEPGYSSDSWTHD